MWLFAMLKGGVRKSTSTMLTAFALARQGHEEVLVIDADPGTQGVTDWASRIYAADPDADVPFDIAQWSQGQGLLVPFIQKQAKNYESKIVLVDVGGEAPEVIRQVLHLTDHVISPVGPEQAELGRVIPTGVVVRETNTPMHVLLTRVPLPGKGVAKDVRDALVGDGFDVLKTEIPQNRDLYAHVWGFVPDTCGAYDDLARELVALSKGAA